MTDHNHTDSSSENENSNKTQKDKDRNRKGNDNDNDNDDNDDNDDDEFESASEGSITSEKEKVEDNDDDDQIGGKSGYESSSNKSTSDYYNNDSSENYPSSIITTSTHDNNGETKKNAGQGESERLSSRIENLPLPRLRKKRQSSIGKTLPVPTSKRTKFSSKRDDIITKFHGFINMELEEIEEWNENDTNDIGYDYNNDNLGIEEHRHLLLMLQRNPDREFGKYLAKDIVLMQKIIAYIESHLEASPGNLTTTFNLLRRWGHDILKDSGWA